jgi:flagellar export protein FliJ
MVFRFSLEPVFRLRTSYERLEKLRLLAMAAMIVRVREEIAAAARDDAAARKLRQETLARGAVAAELQMGVYAEKARARRNRELAERLTTLERHHARQSRVYQAARGKREVMQNLREQKLREYRREQDRRAQQVLDELYLLRRATLTE